ncbi:retinol dehydrogenase 7-like isoform 2-T2 [Anomaloglossus baeobatrachus]|uniref:retinol dehydrogenase 7-like isoform X2 n=1 Tax=Anomaloglossus baeobatrachus TaxID=238106 RepID=UPI003F4F6A5C
MTCDMWCLLLPVGLLLFYLFRWNQRRLVLPNLIDKYVLITGCDSGFGNLAAKQLDKRGMLVLAACLTQKGAENLKKDTSSRLKTVVLDVTDSQSVTAAAVWVESIVGDKGLWGVINNAGVSVPTAPNEWLSKEDFSKLLNVNLLGVVDVTLKMLPLIRRARGRVVNVASIAGRFTICGGAYCMSKYGVESFSDSLRREMRPFGVKVCIIEPGFFATQVADAKLLRDSATKAWAQVSDEIRRSYGQQYYENYCRNLDLHLSLNSSKLSLVTDCMEHALTAVHPKTRYSAGWDAKLLYLPLSYFPAIITDFLIGIRYPKPAKSV